MPTLTSTLLAAGLFSLRDFGGGEILMVLVIILIIFGPSRLPQLSRAVGKSIRDFKRGLSDIKDDIENSDSDETPPQPQTPPVAQSPPPAASEEKKPES